RIAGSNPFVYSCILLRAASSPTFTIPEMTTNKKIRKRLLFAHRRLREWKMIAKGLLSTRHPVLAHIIPTRRCNLSCTYCNEFDDFSNPVPTDEMLRRI